MIDIPSDPVQSVSAYDRDFDTEELKEKAVEIKLGNVIVESTSASARSSYLTRNTSHHSELMGADPVDPLQQQIIIILSIDVSQ